MPSDLYTNKVVVYRSETQGTETSKYLQEEKSNEIPQVVASERGRAQTKLEQSSLGLRTVISYFRD